VPVNVARLYRLPLNPVRAGYCGTLAVLAVLFGCESLQNATAEGDTRTISLHHIHTDEDLTITYKVNGRYDEAALKKINWELRDWRKGEAIEMDPHLIDLVWEVQRDVGASGPIDVVCGYRSPATNAMLRRRSSGVAQRSQHMLGRAMDFYIPGAPLDQLRAIGLYLQRGGVGYYPTSGSPFVHLDTGSVRHWPAIASDQMPRLMAKGRDLHLAAENTRPAGREKPSLIATLFGGKTEQDTPAAAPAPTARPETKRVAAVEPKIERATAVPLPTAKPAATSAKTAGKPSEKSGSYELASLSSSPVQLRPAQAASLVGRAQVSANDVISERGYWQLTPDTPQPAAKAETRTAPARPVAAVTLASADNTGSVAPWPIRERGEPAGPALAYAAPEAPAAAPRALPMGPSAARAAPASIPAAQPDTTIALKRSGNHPSVLSQPEPVLGSGSVNLGDRVNSPWLRAMILTPSAQDFMAATLIGETDYRSLAPYMRKPTNSVMMTFSADPHLGMTCEHFGGSAVVFVATVTFNTRTASLR
jgi:uncharacterized protein YcbK (DUF882 family)